RRATSGPFRCRSIPTACSSKKVTNDFRPCRRGDSGTARTEIHLDENHPPVWPADGRIIMMSRKYDRRSMLAHSAMGGAALAGTLFGAVNETVVEGQGAPAALPAPEGRMRRVVTGHNAAG